MTDRQSFRQSGRQTVTDRQVDRHTSCLYTHIQSSIFSTSFSPSPTPTSHLSLLHPPPPPPLSSSRNTLHLPAPGVQAELGSEVARPVTLSMKSRSDTGRGFFTLLKPLFLPWPPREEEGTKGDRGSAVNSPVLLCAVFMEDGTVSVGTDRRLNRPRPALASVVAFGGYWYRPCRCFTFGYNVSVSLCRG